MHLNRELEVNGLSGKTKVALTHAGFLIPLEPTSEHAEIFAPDLCIFDTSEMSQQTAD